MGAHELRRECAPPLTADIYGRRTQLQNQQSDDWNTNTALKP